MASLQIRCAVLGPVQTNVYFLINEESKETIIVDPSDRADLLLSFLKENDLNLQAILLTHGHYDHIGAVADLQEALAKEGKRPPLYASSGEKRLLADPQLNHSAYSGRAQHLTADVWVEDGQELQLAGFEIKAIQTPGHTEGGICYYIPQEDILLAGDTLFAGSVGRWDLPTGDGEQLIASIRTRLLKLPDQVSVLPGHGGTTTIGREKQTNPYLCGYPSMPDF